MNDDNNEHTEDDGCPLCEARSEGFEDGFIAGVLSMLPQKTQDVYWAIVCSDEPSPDDLTIGFLLSDEWKGMDKDEAAKLYKRAVNKLEKLELITSDAPAIIPNNVVSITSRAVH